MAVTETSPATDEPGTDRVVGPNAVEQLLGSIDHKVTGRIFILFSLLFVAFDLVAAALVNIDAAADLFSEELSIRLWLNHPIGLLLGGVLPLILGLAIYLVPLQVGSPSISFPRAAAMSAWAWLMGVILFSIALGFDGSYGGTKLEMARLGNVSVGLMAVALMAGVGCVMVTVFSGRPAGMPISRVPFFSFSMLVAGTMWVLSLASLVATVTVWQISQPSALDLELLAFPELEWMFHQPAVYLAAIPLLGLALDASSVASGARSVFADGLQAMIGVLGAVSFGVWAGAPSARETAVYVVMAVVASLPVLAVLGACLDTLRRGTPKPTAGLAMAVSSLLLLSVAGVAGLIAAVNTAGEGDLADLAVGGFATFTDSFGVEQVGGPGLATAQLYLIVAAVVVGGLGACHTWAAKLFPGRLPENVGRLLAPVALLGGLVFGAGHLIVGFATPDRSATETLLVITGVGAALLGVVAVAGFVSVAAAIVRDSVEDGSPAEDDEPPEGGTLEWAAPSPPPLTNFVDELPPVTSAYPVFDRDQKGGE